MENLDRIWNQLEQINLSLNQIRQEKSDEWLSIDKAAKHANVDSKTFRRWVDQKLVKPSVVGGVKRIRRSEVDKFLDSCSI